MGTGLAGLFNEPYYIKSSILIFLCLLLSAFIRFSYPKIGSRIALYSAVLVFGSLLGSLNFVVKISSRNLVLSEMTELYSEPVKYAATSGFLQTYIGIYFVERLLETKPDKMPGKLSLLLDNEGDIELHGLTEVVARIDQPEKSSRSIVRGGLPTNSQSIPSQKPNFIFVQFESLDPWVLDYEFNGKSIAPFLSDLKRHSLYFRNFYATHYQSGGSSDPERATLLSLLPHPSTPLNVKRNYRSLVDILNDNGYQTAIFHGNKINYFNRDQFYEHIGVDKKYFGREAFHGEGMGTMSALDKPFYEQSLEYIKEDFGQRACSGGYSGSCEPPIPAHSSGIRSQPPIGGQRKEPFFLYFITMQSHSGFEVYKPETKRYLLDGLDKLLLNGKDEGLIDYMSSIYEADQALGFFFKGLVKHGLLDNTFLFIYSDHNGGVMPLNCRGKCIPLLIYHKDLSGEKMGEVSPSHSDFVYPSEKNEENKNWLDRLKFKKGTYLKVSSHLDMAPTITYILGIQENKDWLGSSLISPQTVLLNPDIGERHPSTTTSQDNHYYSIVPSVDSRLSRFLKRSINAQGFLYYERGIALAKESSLIFNDRNNPFELIVKREILLDYYKHSIDKLESFQ